MKVLFISLGCDKNLVDSEIMLGLIQSKGYSLTNEEQEADVVIINTCCFIHDAKEESIQTILEIAELKKTANLKSLIVSGCLAERYQDEIREELPEIDAILGTTGYEEIVTAIGLSLRGREAIFFKDKNYLPVTHTRRFNTTGGYYAYLKIAEGCDKHCTYCIIPSIRGRYRSVPMDSLILQANDLANSGTKELILVAQETTLYGADLYGEKSLPKLLKELCKIKGFRFIRILYCYPEEITDELIETIKEEDKICNYLDIPIQHASDRILKKMGRNTSGRELERLIVRLRKEIPDIILRTTLITGFPTEAEEDHIELKNFIQRMQFDRLGVFTYSNEEGTPASKLKPQIKEEQKQERYEELMEIQQGIVFEKAKDKIGRDMLVMIEGKIPEDILGSEECDSMKTHPNSQQSIYIGRTYMDAPGVDGCIFINSCDEYVSGDFILARITKAKNYDLLGEPV